MIHYALAIETKDWEQIGKASIVLLYTPRNNITQIILLPRLITIHNFKALTEISDGNYQNTFNKNCNNLQGNNPYRGIKGTHNAQK